MALVIRYIIVHGSNELYYTGNENKPYTMWLHRIPKELIYKTLEEAETKISTLPSDFYKVEKIYKT